MMPDERMEEITYGQGSFGYRCSVCGADDYYGAVKHKAGCSRIAPDVLALRAADDASGDDPR